MKAIELTYDSLLADVANLTKYSEIRGPWWTLQWCIFDAPKLEKHVLRCTETGESLDLQLVPTQLQRLALGAMKDPIQMRYLRQLLLFCYKALVTHDKQTNDRSFEGFLKTNQAVGEFGNTFSRVSPALLRRVSAHCQSVLARVNEYGLKPSHGPGASTTDKDRWTRWYHQIETIYPYSDWYALYYNRAHLAEFGSSDPQEIHIEAKLIAVPKDSRGPRLICVHPAEAIWLQQGLRRELERAISLERYRNDNKHHDEGDVSCRSRQDCVPCSSLVSVRNSDNSKGSLLPTSVDQEAIHGLSPQGVYVSDAKRKNGIRPTCSSKVKKPTRLLPTGPWPHGHVHFDDQSVNGRIALLSSSSRRYATLDMKEASDRISDVLVQTLFGRKYKYFGCCRAQKFRIPRAWHGADLVGDLHCYAPMGNATTFPVQSLVFWAICVASLQHHGFHQPGAVFVFGDDIIVPSECASYVIDDLESFGLLVNKEKSFWRGFFRESCGVDAFKGVNVTPVRWKTTLDAEHLEGMQSLSDIAMRLRMAGYEEAAKQCYAILRSRVEAIPCKWGWVLKRFATWHHVPVGHYRLGYTNNPNHGGIAEYTTQESLVWQCAYWHKDIQWFVTPVLRLKPKSSVGISEGWNPVLESVLSLERTGHSSIPDRSATRRMCLSRGWIQIA